MSQRVPSEAKVVIKYCGHWSQMTPWMVGYRMPNGTVHLLYGTYMGSWEQARKDAIELVAQQATGGGTK